MQIGVTIPNHWGVARFSEVARLGELAEQLGFDSLWVMDHLFSVGYIRARLDDAPYYHPLATLSFLAARTDRIRLGTSVLVLPYHNPVEIAKYAATLDRMSGGRLVLGVGAGGLAEEFEALGVALNQRGRLTNEAMALMKHLWTTPEPDFHSRNWSISGLRFSPRPLHGDIPLWVGGASDGAKRRAGRLGDGWHPIGLPPADYAAGCEQVRDAAREAGRDPAALTMSVRLNIAPAGTPNATPDSLGNPARLVERLRAYEGCGCSCAVLALESGDVAALEAEMRLIAREVLPAMR